MKRPVWIIDDDEDVRAVMVYALEFEGIQVKAFESATRALEHLYVLENTDYPSLMIVDYMMPEMDGVEFIGLLKEARETFGKIPVVLSTARVELDSPTPQGIEFLNKPLDLSDFLSMVKRYYLNETPSQPSV